MIITQHFPRAGEGVLDEGPGGGVLPKLGLAHGEVVG